MSDFKAKNSISLQDLFTERVLYDAEFLLPRGRSDSFVDFKGIKNYWERENLLYGKVNTRLNPISVKKVTLESFVDGDQTFFALPEVVEAYRDMKRLFVQRSSTGYIADDPYLNVPVVKKAFVNADTQYNIYITNIMEDFNSFILKSEKSNDVVDIKVYAKMFFKRFFESTTASFLTRSAYYLSPEVSSLSSGLSLEISDLDPSDDSQKEIFLDSLNFEFYREAAVNFGFLIDKNIPWRLNYDLSSPVNRDKLPRGKTESPVDAYLSRYFYEISTEDIDYIISSIVIGYNTFVDVKPIRKEGSCEFKREKLDKDYVISEVFGIPYWIKKYVLIKNKECDNIYRPNELKKIIFNAIDLPLDQSINYIKTKFDSPLYLEGSTTYDLLKKEFSKNNNFPLDKFDEYVKILIKKATEKIY